MAVPILQKKKPRFRVAAKLTRLGVAELCSPGLSHVLGGQGRTWGARPIPSSQMSTAGSGPAETGARPESFLLGCDGPMGRQPGPGRLGPCLRTGQWPGSGVRAQFWGGSWDLTWRLE